MAQTSGIPALDALLRVYEPLRTLPADVVHIVRRFADAPLLVKLFHAKQAHASGATLDRLVQQHGDDTEPDVTELSGFGEAHDAFASYMRLSSVLEYAAQVGSVRAVEWMLTSSLYLHATDVLCAAATHGHIAILELSCVRHGRRCADLNRRMRAGAAKNGHLETYQWLCAHPLEPNDQDREWEAQYRSPPEAYDLTCAATHGQLAILQWAYAERRDEWQLHVLKHAALANQQHVMEWIYTEGIEADVPDALRHLAYPRAPNYDVDWEQRFEALVWLHDKYPALSLSDTVLDHLAGNTHGKISRRLVKRYPERYGRRRFWVLGGTTDRRTRTRKMHWWRRVASWIRTSFRSWRQQRRGSDRAYRR